MTRNLKIRIILLCLLGAVRLGAVAPPPVEGKTVELPTLVVIGLRIPSSWLEVSWECKGPTSFYPIKRAWISKVGWGTPAAKAGLKTGDTLLAIDGVLVENMNSERIEDFLKRDRARGTRLGLTIQSPGKEKRVVTILFE